MEAFGTSRKGVKIHLKIIQNWWTLCSSFVQPALKVARSVRSTYFKLGGSPKSKSKQQISYSILINIRTFYGVWDRARNLDTWELSQHPRPEQPWVAMAKVDQVEVDAWLGKVGRTRWMMQDGYPAWCAGCWKIFYLRYDIPVPNILFVLICVYLCWNFRGEFFPGGWLIPSNIQHRSVK